VGQHPPQPGVKTRPALKEPPSNQSARRAVPSRSGRLKGVSGPVCPACPGQSLIFVPPWAAPRPSRTSLERDPRDFSSTPATSTQRGAAPRRAAPYRHGAGQHPEGQHPIDKRRGSTPEGQHPSASGGGRPPAAALLSLSGAPRASGRTPRRANGSTVRAARPRQRLMRKGRPLRKPRGHPRGEALPGHGLHPDRYQAL